MAKRIVLITGTDTGVGKTLLTALLLAHGLARGANVLAMKPFCSGGRGDVELLDSIQEGRLPATLLNPFFFEEPVAPLVSSRLHRKRVTLENACEAVCAASQYCDTLLVEGSGGVLVPLGEKFSVLDLICRLKAEVIVVSRNQLGTINHTLLTAFALKTAGIRNFKVVLMDAKRPDFSSRSNASLLRELLAPNPLLAIPKLAGNLGDPKRVRRHAFRLDDSLGLILNKS